MDNDAIPDDYAAWANQPPPNNVHHLANDPDMMTIDRGIGRGKPKPQPATNDAKPPIIMLGDAIRDVKPMQWLIKGLIPHKALTFIHAPPKTGKTFIAVSLACSIATGRDFLGLPVRNRGTVLYVAGEGVANLSKRFDGWCRANDVPPESVPVSLAERAYTLPDEAADISADIQALVAERGLQDVSCIVLDTYRRTLAGDENSNQDAQAYVSACDDLRDKLGCAVVVVHHSLRTGKANQTEIRMTGASSLHASCDCQIALRTTTDDSGGNKALALINTDQKDARQHATIGAYLKPVELVGIPADHEEPDGGNEWTLSAIRDDAAILEAMPKRQTNARTTGKNKQIALDTLHLLIAAHQQTLESSGHDIATAKTTLTDWLEALRKSGKIKAHTLKPAKFRGEIVAKLKDESLIEVSGDFVQLVHPDE